MGSKNLFTLLAGYLDDGSLALEVQQYYTSGNRQLRAVLYLDSGSTNGLSLAISHTTSGTDRLMLVGVSINNDNLETVSSITYNSTHLTYVGSETQADDARVELWMLVAPPVGTNNVVITFSADLLRYAATGVITLTGVNQATPLGSGSSKAAAWEFASFAGKLQPTSSYQT